jgi:hypothetical protein
MVYDPDAEPVRWAILQRGDYLVRHGDKTLDVVDDRTLHTRYRHLGHPPPNLVPRWPSSPDLMTVWSIGTPGNPRFRAACFTPALLGSR